MPRDGSGVYHLPAGNPVVTNTLIQSTWANTTLQDIADALTASLPRDGSAPMTGLLTLAQITPTAAWHAAPKTYVDAGLNNSVQKVGGHPGGDMTGILYCPSYAYSPADYGVNIRTTWDNPNIQWGLINDAMGIWLMSIQGQNGNVWHKGDILGGGLLTVPGAIKGSNFYAQGPGISIFNQSFAGGTPVVCTAANTGLGNSGGNVAALEVDGGGSGTNVGASFMAFHRPGLYATHFGVEVDNTLRFGGWSEGAVTYQIWHQKNLPSPASTNVNNNFSVYQVFQGGVENRGDWLYSIGSRTVTINAGYGYLANGGAGAGGATQNVPAAIYANNRIICPEFNTLSDERAKQDITKLDYQRCEDFVRNVPPISFYWNPDAVADDTIEHFGFSAQQVIRAGFMNLIGGAPNHKVKQRIDEDGLLSPEGVQLTVGYEAVIPIHQSVLQRLLERVTQLEEEVCRLQSA